MTQSNIFIKVLLGSVILSGTIACERNESFQDARGEAIIFGASIASHSTRTEYSGENESDRERIFWKAGSDQITIDQFSKTSGSYSIGNSQSYTVNSRTPENPYTDKGTLDSSSPITWGEQDTYRFFGFYPSGKGTLENGADGFRSTAKLSLPAAQEYPVNMDFAYMYAVTDDIEKPAPKSNVPVKLQFTPMITTLQFEISKSFDKEMTIQSMELESVSATKQALCGDYSYTLSQNSDPTKRNDAAGDARNSDTDSKITIDLKGASVASDAGSPVVVDFFLIPQEYSCEELKLTIHATVDGASKDYTNVLKFKDNNPAKFLPNYKYDMKIVLKEKEITLTTAGKELVFYTIVQICKDKIINEVFKGKTTPSGDNELNGVKLSEMTHHCGDSDYSNFFQDLMNKYIHRSDLKNNIDEKDKFLTDFLEMFEEEMSQILEVIGRIETVSLTFGGDQGLSLNLGKEELTLFKSLKNISFDINDNLDVSITLEDMPYLQDVSTNHGVTYNFKDCPNLKNINLQNFQNATEYNVVIDNCPKFNTLDNSNFTIGSQLEKTNITILNMTELESVTIGQSDGPKTLSISNCEKLTSFTLGDNNKKTSSLTLKDLPMLTNGTVKRGDAGGFSLTIDNCSNSVESGTLKFDGNSNGLNYTKTNSDKLTVTDQSGSPI